MTTAVRERPAPSATSHKGAPARKARAIPSPFLIFALVVKGKTRPQPPVHRMTARAVMVSTFPDISSMATTP